MAAKKSAKKGKKLGSKSKGKTLSKPATPPAHMRNIGLELKKIIDANPRIVEIARKIGRDHAAEIATILSPDDPVGKIIKIAGLVHRETQRENDAPHDDAPPVLTVDGSGNPTITGGVPDSGDGDGDAPPVGAAVALLCFLAAIIIATAP